MLAGYRVHYGELGRTIVILNCDGTKRSQRRDIERAISYWQDLSEPPVMNPPNQILRRTVSYDEGLLKALKDPEFTSGLLGSGSG